jgi:hypothetical protein
VISIFAILAGVVGCFLDGLGGHIIDSLTACASGPNTRASASAYPGTGVTLSGDSSHYLSAYNCYADYIHLNNDCVCVSAREAGYGNTANTCYFYNGNIVSSQHCDSLFTTYPKTIKGAVAMDALVTFLILVLSILTCTTLFCPTVLGEYQFGMLGNGNDEGDLSGIALAISKSGPLSANDDSDELVMGVNDAQHAAHTKPQPHQDNHHHHQHFMGRAAMYRTSSNGSDGNESRSRSDTNASNSNDKKPNRKILNINTSDSASSNVHGNVYSIGGRQGFTPRRAPSARKINNNNPVFTSDDYSVEVQL